MSKIIEVSDPFLARELPVSVLDQVPPLTSEFPAPGVHLEPQEPWQSMVNFRQNFPWTPVIPLPDFSKTVFVDSSGAVDLDMPSAITMAMFISGAPSGVNVAISFMGRAPSFAVLNSDNWEGGILLPALGRPSHMFYLRGRKQLSVSTNSPIATFVPVSCWGWTEENVR